MTGAGVWTAAPGEDGYPGPLRELDDPPRLFGAGRHEVLESLEAAGTVTIVGSRRASAYGLRVAETLARELAIAGVAVVSGMALGIDAAAHRGALAGGGTTIAVLANGPDVVYPALHRQLYEGIVATGAVISEHPPGVRARKEWFRIRNRIMAALGRVVVIVEAAQPSGSLITAEAANNLGRTVGAVPGQIGSRNAAGTNGLIKDGAELIRGTQDVLDLLFGVGATGPRRRPALEPPLDLVLELICDGVATLDGLAERARLAPRDVAVAAARLELLGLVHTDAAGRYEPAGIGPG